MKQVIQGFPSPQKDQYKVYICSTTYNQASYIEDCLNGVAIQETSFTFVHHVIDDASTDGEQDVIKAWMERECYMEHAEYYDNEICAITIVKNKKNPNCTFAAYFLKKNMYVDPKKAELYKTWRQVCPYEALCEGDDYWIDPKKLQKQYDILEAHPEYSLCHHSHKILINGAFEERIENVPKEQDLLSIAERNTVHTLTMFYRNIGEPIIPQNFPFKYPVYQFFYNLRLAEFGKIVYIDEPMAVYRVNEGGVYSQQPLKRQTIMAVGNLENMINWFTNGTRRPDVVEILKIKAKGILRSAYRTNIKQLKFNDAFFFWKWYLRFVFM